MPGGANLVARRRRAAGAKACTEFAVARGRHTNTEAGRARGAASGAHLVIQWRGRTCAQIQSGASWRRARTLALGARNTNTNPSRPLDDDRRCCGATSDERQATGDGWRTRDAPLSRRQALVPLSRSLSFAASSLLTQHLMLPSATPIGQFAGIKATGTGYSSIN